MTETANTNSEQRTQYLFGIVSELEGVLIRAGVNNNLAVIITAHLCAKRIADSAGTDADIELSLGRVAELMRTSALFGFSQKAASTEKGIERDLEENTS